MQEYQVAYLYEFKLQKQKVVNKRNEKHRVDINIFLFKLITENSDINNKQE